MHRTLSIAVAALLFAGHASAAETLRIESEAQFARDYAGQTVRIAPGIYQMTQGAFAGKTITMGENGVAYQIAALRSRVPATFRERAMIQARIKRLERSQARYATLRAIQARATTKASTSSVLPCFYFNPRTNSTVAYNASASVTATTEYYMSNGGGGLNPYYARASASASGFVYRPYGVPFSTGTVSIYALAWNHQTNTLVQYFNQGTSVSGGTGYVYSGPNFSHDLEATAGVEGEGDCFGIVTITDTLR